MTVYRVAAVLKMGVLMGSIRGTLDLKVPCSTTELPALFRSKSTSKSQERQRGPPNPNSVVANLVASLSEEK